MPSLGKRRGLAGGMDFPVHPMVPVTTPGPSPRRDPGRPGELQSGRPLRCPSRTSPLSHGAVSVTFPGRYAPGTDLHSWHGIVSAVFRTAPNPRITDRYSGYASSPRRRSAGEAFMRYGSGTAVGRARGRARRAAAGKAGAGQVNGAPRARGGARWGEMSRSCNGHSQVLSARCTPAYARRISSGKRLPIQAQLKDSPEATPSGATG